MPEAGVVHWFHHTVCVLGDPSVSAVMVAPAHEHCGDCADVRNNQLCCLFALFPKGPRKGGLRTTATLTVHLFTLTYSLMG